MSAQIQHYSAKLAYEIDSWDLSVALIVTYCDGIGCNASTKGALNMATLGFNVKELIGGLDWWKRDGHSTAGAQGSQRNGEISCGC